jgi:hypothetical protein
MFSLIFEFHVHAYVYREKMSGDTPAAITDFVSQYCGGNSLTQACTMQRQSSSFEAGLPLVGVGMLEEAPDYQA